MWKYSVESLHSACGNTHIVTVIYVVTFLILTHWHPNSMLPYIPQEILDKIIGCAADGYSPYDVELDDWRKFSSCASFVSHTFHQIVLPYKFRSLTFEFHNKDSIRDLIFRSTDCTTLIPIPKFCEAIHAKDLHALSLAPLVEELSLLYWRGNLKDCFHNYIMPKPFQKIINSVLSFRNLTKLKRKMCYLPRHRRTTWKTCTTPVVAHMALPRRRI